jgi:hypothetical protein
MTEVNSWTNNGVMMRPGSLNEIGGGRTFIISGIGRGGTTMVAAVLREAGIPMGDRFHEAAVEDVQAGFVLRQSDRRCLDEFVARRNSQYASWGFKTPDIHALLRHSEMSRFRNPHLILIFRDPVAIALRRRLSDYQDPMQTLIATTLSTYNLVQFFTHTVCPAMLLSYEKALIFPEVFIKNIAEFCGLQHDPESHRRMLQKVNPNSSDYATGATLKIAGYLEALRNNTLFGWCAYANFWETMELDLFVNDTKALTFTAQKYRADVMSAGYGNGNSGFEVDLFGIRLAPEDRLHVRLSQRPLFELSNSGRTVAEYRQSG